MERESGIGFLKVDFLGDRLFFWTEFGVVKENMVWRLNCNLADRIKKMAIKFQFWRLNN